MPFISVKDILPYCNIGYEKLIKQNPKKIIVFFGEDRYLNVIEWNKKFNDLPAICTYSPSLEPPTHEQYRLIQSFINHLKLLTNLKEIVLSPELSRYSYFYCKRVKDSIKNNYKVLILKPYPDCPDWNNLNNIQSENVSMLDYLWEYPFLNLNDIYSIIEDFN
jgi:hypothetical protein